MKVVVLHRYYGCDTGCCGHAVEVDDKEIAFDFDHPYSDEGDKKEWAVDFARKAVENKYGQSHAFDLAWDECVITDGLVC